MDGVTTESAPFLLALALLGGFAGVMVGIGLDRYMGWVRSTFPAPQARFWRVGFLPVPLLIVGAALDGLNRGPDADAFIVGGLVGLLGHSVWDFRRWLRERKPK